MLSVTFLFILAAFVTTIANAIGKCPIWVPMLLVVLVLLLGVLPK